MKFLYFSDYINATGRTIKFVLIVLWRFIVILFRWRKRIQERHLHYETKNQFDKSLLVIHYKFKNVLWYSFKNIKRTTEDNIILFNIDRLPTTDIIFFVYGFFTRRKYIIKVIPEKQLQTISFRKNIIGINSIKSYSKELSLNSVKPIVINKKIRLSNLELEITNPDINIIQSSFNQTDFI